MQIIWTNPNKSKNKSWIIKFNFRYCVHDLKHSYINGTNIALRILGYETLEDNLVVCTLNDDYNMELFQRNDENVQFFGKFWSEHITHQLSPNELCLARTSSGYWYRAAFIREWNDKLLVYCIDYGVFCTVMLKDIRVRIFSRNFHTIIFILYKILCENQFFIMFV